ncbi:MAG TPA: ATP-dependent DNA helicase [Acidimicrobiia bacterium]
MTLNKADRRIGPSDWEEALANTEGPQIIVAGPGTGKTEFLVRRARFLIEGGLADPAEVLVLTFSRRTAADISSRSSKGGVPIPGVATYHAFARRLLETHATTSGLPGTIPTLLTTPEQTALVRELLAKEDPADWPVPLSALLSSPTLASEIADFLLRCQERIVSPEALAGLAASWDRWRALPPFMERYLAELRARNRLDYGSILAQAISLLEGESVREAVSQQFRYLLVDEYQDTSAAQARLLELLSAQHRNITVTGDPYQSIYSFRGADLENVALFPDRFRTSDGTQAQRLILTTSFRVPAQILDSALRIVSGGDLPGGAGKVTPASHLGRVEAYVFDQASGEADWIAGKVERLHLESRIPYSRMAVLVRSSRHLLPELSRALERREIGHLRPDRRLSDHPAVRIIFDLAIASFAQSQEPGPGWAEEADQAMRRLLLGPLLSISLGRERELLRERRRTRRSWSDILATGEIGSPELCRILADPQWCRESSAADGFWQVWTTLPELVTLVEDPGLGDFRRAWTELSQALDQQRERDPSVDLIEYERLSSLDDFEAVPLLSIEPAQGDQLTLTTLHQAKGLEFDVVIIADAAEGVFPSLQRRSALLRPDRLNPAASTEEGVRFRLQEEMRLAYTAMTRARSQVIWTATAAAIDEGERRPSRFLLAASGAASFTDLGPPGSDPTPVTAAELQALLRLTVSDPTAPQPDRLAALSVLAAPGQTLWDARRFAGTAERGPDTGVITLPLRMAPTSAQSYEDCPRRYVFERHLEATDVASPYAHYGSLIHLVLERAESNAIDSGRPRAQVEEALDELERVWAELADFGSPILNDAWKAKGRKLITNLYENWPGNGAIGIRTEKKVTADIGNVVWRGRIDRIEQPAPGQLRIVDYKTGTQQPTVSEAAASLQLGFYLLAVKTDPELSHLGDATEAELWFPECQQPRRKFDYANLKTVIDRLGALTGGILNEQWDPKPGKQCERCGVRLVCPAWPEGREGFRL